MNKIAYNYERNMVTDILDWIDENMTIDDIIALSNLSDTAIDDLFDELWLIDSVTGNASGSYWFSRWHAEEALLHNWDLCIEAIKEIGAPKHICPETLDVTIRCYLLHDAILEAIKRIPERFLL